MAKKGTNSEMFQETFEHLLNLSSFPRLSTAELVKRESIFTRTTQINMDSRLRGNDDPIPLSPHALSRGTHSEGADRYLVIALLRDLRAFVVNLWLLGAKVLRTVDPDSGQV